MILVSYRLFERVDLAENKLDRMISIVISVFKVICESTQKSKKPQS